MAEVAVTWQEVPGSKLNILDSTFTMARDLLLIRLCFLTGLWKIEGADEARAAIAKRNAD